MSGAADLDGPPLSGGAPRLEKYELLEEIGHGGMATVYRALDPRLGREVAVKVIHKHLRENTEVATRFVAEARAAAKLRHPNIVEVFDVSTEEDAERFLVVELLRGTTLRKVLQQHREMPAEVGAAIVLEICEALEHAHESGIIHRDIKPENVLVELPGDRTATSAKGAAGLRPVSSRRGADPDASGQVERAPDEGLPRGELGAPKPSEGRGKRAKQEAGVVIKITDFGIAKILDAQGVTSTGQVLGSPAHMAPEQIEGGEVDARTDVFALGVLMYECLVGHLPFEGKNPAQVLRKVLDGIYPPADRERATVGGRWAKILAGALARERADRTVTPGVLGEQIRGELEELGVTDPRAEVSAYFADPKAHVEDLIGRIVPRLVARGEAARRAGDVPGAAADFNRALALSPNDLAILKRLTALTSSATRRLLLKRVAAIGAGTAFVALLSFGIAKYVKAWQRDRAEAAAEASAAAVSAPSASPVLPVTTAPDPTPSAGPRVPASGASTGKPKPPVAATGAGPGPTATAAGPAPAMRKVRFAVKPLIAKLSIDGQEVGHFNTVHELLPGPRSFTLTTADKCCKSPKTMTRTVEPPNADKPDAEQTIVLQMDFVPVKVSLSGDPDAQMACPAANLMLFGRGTTTVTPKEMDWKLSCTFKPAPEKGQPFQHTITIKAGEDNRLSWPAH